MDIVNKCAEDEPAIDEANYFHSMIAVNDNGAGSRAFGGMYNNIHLDKEESKLKQFSKNEDFFVKRQREGCQRWLQNSLNCKEWNKTPHLVQKNSRHA